ncbi:hypothetical protein QYF61_022819 [Mycteria americana]|uniref:Uncharacterized protein n=1 Tax=Mycteria americana TaxID=33587 RepID=A0AAN7S5H4_MYCAM|nr:hypothetical protein QYF61_022819 [Mycteria americana]
MLLANEVGQCQAGKTSHDGEETDPHLSTTSFQAKQPQFPQPLLIRLVLQTLHQLRCPSLDTPQHLNVSLVVRAPNTDAGDANTGTCSPVPVLDNPFNKEIFPNIQPKPPLAQLEAISSCPTASYLGEETDPHLSTTSFQTKQPQFPQPLLIRLGLQTLHQLRCPSLDTLQHLNVSLVVRGPKLNTGFEVRPHQCQVQGHDHCPSPAGHTIFDTSQDAIGFLGHLGTLLAHIQVAVDQHPQVLLCLAAFQPLFPKPVVLHGVAMTQVQDLALGLVEPHTIDLGPSIQPVHIPLQRLPTLPTLQLGVVCKLTEGALNPLRSRSLIKIFNRTGPSTEPWGTPLVTSHQLDLTPFTTTLWAQPSS